MYEEETKMAVARINGYVPQTGPYAAERPSIEIYYKQEFEKVSVRDKIIVAALLLLYWRGFNGEHWAKGKEKMNLFSTM